MTYPLDRKLVVEFIGMFIFVFTVGMVTNKAGAGAAGASRHRLRADGDDLCRRSRVGRTTSTPPSAPRSSFAEGWPRTEWGALHGRPRSWRRYWAASGWPVPSAATRPLLTSQAPGRCWSWSSCSRSPLAWVVLNVATARGHPRSTPSTGWRSGSRCRGAFAVGGISGGVFNPAIAIGGMVTGLFKWSNIWVYLLAEFLGAAAAAYPSSTSCPQRSSRATSKPPVRSDRPTAAGGRAGAIVLRRGVTPAESIV